MTDTPPTKIARVFEGALLSQGKLKPAETPDWDNVLSEIKRMPFKERTLGQIVYDPVKTRAGWALSMHEPISRSYKSILRTESGAVEDWLTDESSGQRFAYSTAVVFLNRGATFALCKGEHRAPGHPDVEKFLAHFLEPKEQGARWKVSPVVAPAETPRFNEVTRVRSLDLAMTTRADLFTHSSRGQGNALDALLSALADQVGADMQVRLQVSIEKAQRSSEPERRLKGVVEKSMDWITASGTRAVVETEDRGGVREALNLVTHDLAVEIGLPPESTERQSFRDIMEGLVAQLGYLNMRITEGSYLD